MSRYLAALLAGFLALAPVDELVGQERNRVGLSQPPMHVAVGTYQVSPTAFGVAQFRRQRTWTIVGGAVGAVVGYTVVRDHLEVPSGTFRAAALAAGMAAIGAFIGYVLGS